jgi:hypothetical protein
MRQSDGKDAGEAGSVTPPSCLYNRATSSACGALMEQLRAERLRIGEADVVWSRLEGGRWFTGRAGRALGRDERLAP